jgi:hypothetical protein
VAFLRTPSSSHSDSTHVPACLLAIPEGGVARRASIMFRFGSSLLAAVPHSPPMAAQSSEITSRPDFAEGQEDQGEVLRLLLRKVPLNAGVNGDAILKLVSEPAPDRSIAIASNSAAPRREKQRLLA